MTEPTQDIAPADFDLDAWISGVQATVRSCVITGRGDLVAQAEDLLRRYETLKNTSPDDLGITDDSTESLVAQLEQLEEQLAASRTVWHLRALTPEQIIEASKAAEAAKPAGEDAVADFTAHQIAAAVVRVERPDGAVATSVTAAQVDALRKRLGEPVVIRLFQILERAMSEEPLIAAPFSPKSSPDRDG